MAYKEYMKCKDIRLVPTSSDIEGPFYKPDAPFLDSLSEHPTLVLSGRVMNVDGKPIDACLDFWHADEHGVYDLEGFKLRCKVKTTNGQYELSTIVPGDYQIDEHEFRCAHIHVKITADGYKPLTTQLYFAGDKYNETDHWFDPSRMISPRGTFDFILEAV